MSENDISETMRRDEPGAKDHAGKDGGPDAGGKAWMIGAAMASGAAAGLLVWWSPEQETVFGLTAGAAAGYLLHRQFAAMRRRKEAIRRILADEWGDTGDCPQYMADARTRAYWVRDLQSESMRWMNAVIGKLWPYLNEGISRTVIETLEPMLDSYKPSAIREIYFQKFTLGEVPFSFSGMRMIKGPGQDATEDALEFLMDVRWAGDIDIALAVNAAGSDLCQVKMKNMHISGTVRVVMRPFLPVIPCFGSVAVAFEYPPDIDFELKMTGALAATNVVTSFIRTTVQDYIESYFLWPQKMIVPMFDEETVQPSLYETKERAVLHVRFVEASSLRNADGVGGSSDPFAEAYIDKKARVFRTSIKHNEHNPEWDEESFFMVCEDSQLLFVTINDSDGGYSSKDVLGRVQVGPLNSIPGLMKGETVDQWFDLGEDEWYTRQKDGTRGCGKGAGRVRLQLKCLPVKDLMAFKRKAALTRSTSIAKAGQVQQGILFFNIKRAVNIGTGSLCATAKVKGHSLIATPYGNGILAEEHNGTEEEAKGKEESRWWSTEVVWPVQPGGARDGFYGVKTNQSLQIEVLKTSKKVNKKSVGYVHIPLALIASPEAPDRITSMVALEGLSKSKYAGAAIELEIDWIPLDPLPIPDIDAIYERMGLLYVRVCNGHGLKKTDLTSDPDPFVELRLGSRKRRKTPVLNNTRSPAWMQEYCFLRADESETLLVTVLDEGPTGSDHMGDVAIPLRAIRKHDGRLSGVWKLQNTTKGTVCMDLAWVPYSRDNGPYRNSGRPEEAIDRTAFDPPLWGLQPLDELVPPHAFDMIKVDVEVELLSTTVSGLFEQAAGNLHCRLNLKGSPQDSKAVKRSGSTAIWNEKFKWEAVPQFGILEVCILSSEKDVAGNHVEIGTVAVNLRDVRNEDDHLRQLWEIDRDGGSLELDIKMKPCKNDGSQQRSSQGACLNVTLIGASELVAKDVNGKSDPKCWLKIREQRFKSTTQCKTLNPIWNEHFQFVDLQPNEVLEVKVFDYDRVGSSSPLGQVLINLQEVLDAPGQTLENTWVLQDTKKGKINMKLVWVNDPSTAAARLTCTSPQQSNHDELRHDASSDDSNPRVEHAAALAGPATSQLQPNRVSLKMTLHSCTGLPKAPGLGLVRTMDCYVKATLGKSDQEYRSPVITNSRNPVWENEEFTFSGVAADDMFKVRLADKTPVGRKVLGYVMIPVQSVLSETKRVSYPCSSEKGEPVGSVEMSFTRVPSNNSPEP